MSARARLFLAMLGCLWLWGCLLEKPLGRADEAYDARAALRGDSLAGFDSVDVFLVDAEDGTVVAHLWRGPLGSAEDLGAGVAGDGSQLVYVVMGHKRDRGACFQYRKAQGDSARVLVDTCDVRKPDPVPDKPEEPEQNPVPVDPGPAEPPPRFVQDNMELRDSLPMQMLARNLPAIAPILRAEPGWLQAGWVGLAGPSGNSMLVVRGQTANLEAGMHMGRIIMEVGGLATDTLAVRLSVSQRYVRGLVADWISRAPQPGIRVDLESGAFGITGADGKYEIPVPVGQVRHPARFSAPGRIGALDTLPLADDAGAATNTRARITLLPSEAAFRAVDLSSMRSINAIAACAGYGIVLSTPFRAAGEVVLVRLDGPRPAFEKSFPLANDDGDPELPEYFEAGELAADSEALFIAYPEAHRIGRVGNWRSVPKYRTVSTPLLPGGLLLDGDRLLTLGRLGDGTLALARFRAADLTLLGVDTLSGYAWDGMLPLQRSPRLAAGNGAYYAVHGNDPSTRGPILRLDRETGKVIVEQESPESRLGELVRIGDRIYASSPSPDSRLLLGFDADLFPVDTVKVGMPIARLAADSAGAFAGYGFAAAGDKALAFVPGGKAVLGALPIPTTGEARWIAVDGRTRTVLISDGAILYAAVFRPD